MWICNDNNNTLKKKNLREFVKYILDTSVVVISEVSGVKYKGDEEHGWMVFSHEVNIQVDA